MRRVLVACVVAFVAGVVASFAAGGSGSLSGGRWVVRDLGTLGGSASSAVDINERGEVVGWRYTVRTRIAMPSRHAFLWSHGKMRDLGTLPLGGRGDIPNASEATALSDRGQVIGTSWREQTGPTPHVFVWFKGEMEAVGCGRVALARCEVGSTAAALNERGLVVGSISPERGRYTFGFGGRVAFTWVNGTLTRLGALPGRTYSRARDVSERGDVVGASYALSEQSGEVRTRAFLWHEGKMTDLGALPGSSTSEAVALNARGQIIGNSSGAFLWQNGRMTALGTLPGQQYSGAAAINDRGQVVGSSGSSFRNDRGDTIGQSASAFLWQNGKMTALPKLPRGGTSAPTAINDRGQIVGWCGGRQGEDRHVEHAVLWTWKPAR
jgi:probable HAF family extracellular repeat protein